MSDDIRVYWDELTEDYCIIMLDTGDFYWGYNMYDSPMYDSPYDGSGFDAQLWIPFDLGESIPSSYSLVYDSAEEIINNDIRVYWSDRMDDYYIFFGNNSGCLEQCGVSLDTTHYGKYRESMAELNFTLVYDSAEDDDDAWIKLIDDNLVVPDIENGVVIRNKQGRWKSEDIDIWVTGYRRLAEYHQGKEWTA